MTVGAGGPRQQFHEVGEPFQQGQDDGVFRPELDARLASWGVYGGLEEILTGWVFGRLAAGPDDVARAEQTVIAVLTDGLAAN